VEGIVLSIKRAHTSLTPGYLSLAKGLVSDANVNRSPYAYEANPAEERAKYEDVGGDVDKEMTVLSFKKEDGTPLGSVFPEYIFHYNDLLHKNLSLTLKSITGSSIGSPFMGPLSTGIIHSSLGTTKATPLFNSKKISEMAL
jgi:hypothetical protein